MKPKILSTFAVALITLLLLSCKDEHGPSEVIDSNLQQVIGNYEATLFLIPDKSDGNYDVIKEGGYLNITLTKDKTVTGKILIPPSRRLADTSGFKEDFTGIFTIKNDTIQFKGFYNIISNPQLYFVWRDNKLVATMISISPTKITLQKKWTNKVLINLK